MQDYELQYSFMSAGESGIQSLRELNQKLQALEGHSLAKVYGAFDRVASQVRATDIIDKVGIVRSTRADKQYGFFVMVTKTTNMKHTTLWTEICKQDYPEVGVAVLGTGTEGNVICETLYLPKSVELKEVEMPSLPAAFGPVTEGEE